MKPVLLIAHGKWDWVEDVNEFDYFGEHLWSEEWLGTTALAFVVCADIKEIVVSPRRRML